MYAFVGANGVYQNTIYGLAAKLPFKYTGGVVLGSVSMFLNLLKILYLVPDKSKKIHFGLNLHLKV